VSGCFVDTSAAYAALDASDEFHTTAVAIWERLLEDESEMVTSNYVIVETTALLQARLGADAARGFLESIVPLMRVEWVDEGLHNEAARAYSLAMRKRLSLVDCVSFLMMRTMGLRVAFAFDRHFRDQGFETLSKAP
jgi:uncharacterized protein